MTEIILAENAGFCYGVDRAVNMVRRLLDEGARVCTLGPIIHNYHLLNELAERGVRIVEQPDEAGPDDTLVIRSHGVGRAVLDSAAASKVKLVDATCPFVKKIHLLVEKADKEGKTVLIAGDRNHKEVVGIMGYTGGPCEAFRDESELEDLIRSDKIRPDADIIVVAQTTFNRETWDKCEKIFKKSYTNAVFFDTICDATSRRQSEAVALALRCDVMIVIGDRHSSNSSKLEEVCRSRCEKTFFIETADELKAENLIGAGRIGVVAGASTPAGIIKEVVKTMSEIVNSAQSAEEVNEAAAQPEKSFDEMTFEEALEASLNSLNTDQKVKGVVVSVNPTEIQVDIGRKQTGYVPASEYSNDPGVKLTEVVKPGDILDLIVMRTNDQEGTIMLSKRRFDSIAGWDKIVEAKENNAIIDGVVSDVIKGGVVAYSNGVRVFIPASQATASRGDSLEELKGKEVSFRIIEIGRGRRAVGSIRSVLRERRNAISDELWQSIAVGDRFTGTVKSLTGYGAFVDIGGVDGMVHISELSWERIKHPSEVVSVGDTIEVYVKALDAEKRKISLGYKKADENPWEIFNRDYSVGDVVKVKIVNMTAYGAFARIIPGVDGLIHISQIANRRVEKPQDELSIGQEVEAKITDIDGERRRISLSIRALLPQEAPADETDEAVAETAEAPVETVSAEVADTVPAEPGKPEEAADQESADKAE